MNHNAIRCLMRWMVLGYAALVLPGCSLLFVDRPPANHPQRRHFTCTTSRLGPVVDSLVGIGSVITGLVLITTRDEFEDDFDNNDEDTTVGLVNLGVAVLYGASAVQGFMDTAECDQAFDALEERRLDDEFSQSDRDALDGCVTNEQCKVGRICFQGSCADAAGLMPTAPLARPPATQEVPVLLFAEPPQPTPPTPEPPTPESPTP